MNESNRIGVFCLKYKFEIVFAITTLIVCVCYSCRLGFGEVYDERSAFNTSYSIMRLLLGEGGEIVERDYQGVKGINVLNVEIYAEDDCVITKLDSDSAVNMINESGMIKEDIITVSYAPFPTYIIDSIVILIGKIIGLSGYPLFFFVRYINMIIYIMFGLIAMNVSKSMKTFSFVLYSMPMSIMHAATCNYNALFFPFVFFVTILIGRYIYEKEELKRKDIILVFISIILVAPIKGYMIGIVFLILMINRNKIRDKYSFYYMGIIIGMLVWLAYNLLSVDVKDLFINADNNYIEYSGNRRVSVLDFIIDPIYIKGIINQFIYKFISVDLIGNAHSPIDLGRLVSIGYFLCFTLSATCDEGESDKSRLRFIYICLILLVMYFLLCIITMFSWNGSIPDIKSLYIVPYYGVIGMGIRESLLCYKSDKKEDTILMSIVSLSFASCMMLLFK